MFGSPLNADTHRFAIARAYFLDRADSSGTEGGDYAHEVGIDWDDEDVIYYVNRYHTCKGGAMEWIANM